MAPRGVWRLPYEIDGSEAAFAIDSKRRRVAVVVLHEGVDRRAVKRLLTILLDAIDPVMGPRLVADRPVPHPTPVQDDASLIRAWVEGDPSPADDALLSMLRGGYPVSAKVT